MQNKHWFGSRNILIDAYSPFNAMSVSPFVMFTLRLLWYKSAHVKLYNT